ncbi:MAG: hypothetical protein ACJA2W_002959 [Planctomycetota bacterium]|jgi:hypothetical protein
MEIGGVTYKWWTETRVTRAIIGLSALGYVLKWIGSEKRISAEAPWLVRRLERIERATQAVLIPDSPEHDAFLAKSVEQWMSPELSGQLGDAGLGWRTAGSFALLAGLGLLMIRIASFQHVPKPWWLALTLGPLAVASYWLKYETGYQADSGEAERLVLLQAAGLTATGLFCALRWRA